MNAWERMLKITIRSANLPQNYAAIGAALATEELAHEDASRDLRYHHAAFVAEVFERHELLIVALRLWFKIRLHKKLRGIRYAQEHDNQKLWVVNDAVNTAMLGLNAKLGFVREGVNVRYLKVLA